MLMLTPTKLACVETLRAKSFWKLILGSASFTRAEAGRSLKRLTNAPVPPIPINGEWVPVGEARI